MQLWWHELKSQLPSLPVLGWLFSLIFRGFFRLNWLQFHSFLQICEQSRTLFYVQCADLDQMGLPCPEPTDSTAPSNQKSLVTCGYWHWSISALENAEPQSVVIPEHGPTTAREPSRTLLRIKFHGPTIHDLLSSLHVPHRMHARTQ